MDEKKPDVPPRLTPYDPEKLPDSLQPIQQNPLSETTLFAPVRRAKRYGFLARAKVTDLQSEIHLQGRTTDLSLYGCGVSATEHFPAGTRVRVTVDHEGATFTAIGRVAYATSGDMGIAFVRIEPDDQMTLEKWISEISA